MNNTFFSKRSRDFLLYTDRKRTEFYSTIVYAPELVPVVRFAIKHEYICFIS